MKQWLILSILVPLLATTAPAIEFVQTNVYSLGTDEVLEDELWLVAAANELAGTIRDDVFMAAVSNIVTGTVEADLWAAGERVSVTGRVADDARLAARTVEVDGQVGGDLMAVGESIRLGEQCHVEGDARLAGGQVVCTGVLGGDVMVRSRQATLGGHIKGSVYVMAEDIAVLRDTRVDGDLVYTGDRELFLDESVSLGGELVRKPRGEARTLPLSQVLMLQGIYFLAALAVGIPFIAILPATTSRSVRVIRHAPWRCLLTGATAMLVLLFIVLISAMVVLGLPLALVLGCLAVLLIYLSKIVVALTLGGILLRRHGQQSFTSVISALFVGLVLLYFVALLPIVGSYLWLVVVVMGSGGLVIGILAPEHRWLRRAEPAPTEKQED